MGLEAIAAERAALEEAGRGVEVAPDEEDGVPGMGDPGCPGALDPGFPEEAEAAAIFCMFLAERTAMS